MHITLMKNTLIALSLAGVLATAAQAQNSPPPTPMGDLTGTGAISYESQYVFRGKKIADSSIQPKAEVGMQLNANSNFYIGSWANEPVSRRSGAGAAQFQKDEIDLYAGVYYDLPANVSVDVGDTYYWYPENGGSSVPSTTGIPLDRSDEAYIGFIYNTASMLPGNTNLNPAVYYYHDFNKAADTVEVSARYTWDLTQALGFSGLSLQPRIYGGWYSADREFGDQLAAGTPNWRNGYIYYGASFDLNYMLSPYCYLYGSANFAGNTDGNTGGPASIGGNPQLGGTRQSAWFGVGLKFRK
jgi:uncharacterized protein (TIGR02001 family)